MADRTSAGIFGSIFKYLAAGEPDERAKLFARELWERLGEYDFNHYQMYCDDQLVKLGLAHITPDGMAYLGDHNFTAP